MIKPLDTPKILEDLPEHSLESRICKVVCISCSCCRPRLRFGDHRLCNRGQSLVTKVQLVRKHLHFTLRQHAPGQRKVLQREGLPGVRTPSGPAGVACLKGLALDKRILDGGRHQGAKSNVKEFSRRIILLLRERCYIHDGSPVRR